MSGELHFSATTFSKVASRATVSAFMLRVFHQLL